MHADWLDGSLVNPYVQTCLHIFAYVCSLKKDMSATYIMAQEGQSTSVEVTEIVVKDTVIIFQFQRRNIVKNYIFIFMSF